jgi:hypothetical protein
MARRHVPGGGPVNIPTLLSHGTCPVCGKIRYASRASARKAGSVLFTGTRLRAYRCGTWWHLTSADHVRTVWLRARRAA